jgi:hypothetical protein
MADEDAQAELEAILDGVGYELTRARSEGLGNPQGVRDAMRRAGKLVAQADALAAAAAVPKDEKTG